MRLIDADKFMERLLKLKDLNERCPLEKEQLEDKEVNNYDLGQKETFELVMEHLVKQPTSYDIDDVIKQLGEVAFIPGDRIGVSETKIIFEEKAKGIVRAGLRR